MTVPGRKLEVELVESTDGELDALDVPLEPGEGDPLEPARPRWTWRRVRRAWPLAVVALLVAAAYGVTGARERAAEEARLEALGGQRGFVVDLSRPLQPVWEASSDLFWISVVHGEVAVGESWAGLEDHVQVALDVRTGFELWSLPSETGWARSCWKALETDYATGPALACSAAFEPMDGDAEHDPAQLERGFRVEHRDLSTGELLAESSERLVLAAAPLGADLVELVTADGASLLRRVGLDGEVRWVTRLADLPDEEVFHAHVFTEGEIVLLVVGDRAFAVDAAGRVIGDHQFDTSTRSELEADVDEYNLPFYGHIEPIRAGGFAVSEQMGRSTWVYGADGELVHTATDSWPVSALDDGSLGRVLTLSGDELAVIDLDTGAELVRDRESHVAAILGGAAIVEGRGKVRSVDGESGEERWSVPAGQVVGSDGRLLLVHESDGLSYVLRALDLGSGEERWRVNIGPDAWADVLEGRVLVRASDGLTLYGS